MGRWVHCGGMDMVSSNNQVIYSAQSIPHTITPQAVACTVDIRLDGCFHVVYAKFWPYHLNFTAKITSRQTKWHFCNFLLSVEICFLLSAGSSGNHSLVFCCSGADVLCTHRCSSLYLVCSKWWFGLPLPSCHVRAAWLFSSDLWHQHFHPMNCH